MNSTLKNWYVLYTKPKNEKKAALLLKKIGVTVFCPVVHEVHQWSDRKKKVEVPLIKSYLFVHLEASRREVVFQIPGIVRYLYWLGKPAIVRNEEIELLKEWLSGEINYTSVESLRPGDNMHITTGPFKGNEGVVQELSNTKIQLYLIELGMKITLRRNTVSKTLIQS